MQGRKVDTLKFSVSIISESEFELQRIFKKNRLIKEELSIKIRIHKTKILVCSISSEKRTTVKFKVEILQEVKQLRYFGSKITSDGRSC